MKISILLDNRTSWYLPWAMRLQWSLRRAGHAAYLFHDTVAPGDIACILSCENIVSKETLALNKHNLIVHSSDLPQGRGFSPLTYQILEGKNVIVNTLFEAIEDADAGVIYDKRAFTLNGTELLSEMHEIQGAMINEMILDFIANPVTGLPQIGESSYYKRRIPKDSELDINKTINEQFSLLRVVDNDRYPAFFYRDGCKYVIRITKEAD